MQIKENKNTRKIIDAEPGGKLGCGILWLRWIDDVVEDLRTHWAVGIGEWRLRIGMNCDDCFKRLRPTL